jgi:hypothetical protein
MNLQNFVTARPTRLIAVVTIGVIRRHRDQRHPDTATIEGTAPLTQHNAPRSARRSSGCDHMPRATSAI